MVLTQAPRINKVKIYSIITFILLMVGSAISYWVANRIDFYTKVLVNTSMIMYRSNELYASILERESNIRGYIITGQQEFLENYESSSKNGEDFFREIQNLTKHNPTQQGYLNQLKDIMDIRLEIFERTKEYYGTNGSMEGFITDERVDNALIGYLKIKELIQNINNEEERLFIERNTILLNNIQALPIIVGLISFFSILMGAMTIFSILHFNKAQKINFNNIKQYQDSLKEKIELLDKSNKELQQFAYVASHDLQEPLRKITSFSDLLTETYSDQLEGDGKDYLDRITAASQRMRLLITDLLEYSRVGRDTASQMESVNLESVVSAVLEDMEIAIKEKNAIIRKAPLPSVIGKETELRQVFQNLISNALKFHHPESQVKIEIKCSTASDTLVAQYPSLDQSQDYYLIEIADNGIGFSQEYADRIFTIFQRLHGKDEFEGTGIGLAISKKIVENYGGIIFATSQETVGSTFSCLLPMRKENLEIAEPQP